MIDFEGEFPHPCFWPSDTPFGFSNLVFLNVKKIFIWGHTGGSESFYLHNVLPFASPNRSKTGQRKAMHSVAEEVLKITS